MFVFPRIGASARHQSVRSAQQRKRLSRLNAIGLNVTGLNLSRCNLSQFNLTRVSSACSAIALTALPVLTIFRVMTALPVLAGLPIAASAQTTSHRSQRSDALSAHAASVRAASRKADAFLSSRMMASSQSGWSSIIIQLTAPPTPAQISRIQALQADINRRLPVIHALAARVPTRNLARLAALPFVHRLSADTTVKKFDAFTVTSSMDAAAFSQYGLTGTGVTVAVLDSGVQGSQDLGGLSGNGGLIQSVTVVGGKPDDLCGHGTHVAGIIGGNGAQSTGNKYTQTFYGIAPLAKIISVRALDQNGQGTVSGVVAGIQWVVSNQAKYGIRVLNLSLGHPIGDTYQNDPLCQAVESAWKAGIVVVCAAGNEGRISTTQTTGASNEGWGTAYGSIESPGNDPYVITVGATKSVDGVRAHDQIATYSSRGPSRLDLVLKPDIIAPGNRIISLDDPNGTLEKSYGSTNDVPMSYYQNIIGPAASQPSKAYFQLSGTSMATPVVAGAAALLLQANPKLTPDTIKARLMLSADKWTAPNGVGDPCTYGAGYLNIQAALGCTFVATQSAISPTLAVDTSGNVYLDASRALWGTGSIWGTGITDYRALWGTNALWGVNANILDASRALWGTSVWNDRALWGTTTTAADVSKTAITGEK